MTEYFQEQMQHKPTKDYYQMFKEVVNRIADSKSECLEVGTSIGISTRVFFEIGIKKLTSIDMRECHQASREIAELERLNDWEFIKGDSRDVLPRLEKRGHKYDLIFLDGDHDYKTVRQDIYNAWKLLKKGGCLLAHDCIHNMNFTDDSMGVMKALGELARDYNKIIHIYPSITGIAVILK